MESSDSIELRPLSPGKLLHHVYSFDNSVLSTEYNDRSVKEEERNFSSSLQNVPDFIRNMTQHGHRECPFHPNEDLNLYCRDCKKAICDICQKKHKKHDTILYSLSLTEKYDNLLASLSQFKMISETLNSADVKASGKQKEAEQDMLLIEQDIKVHFKQFRKKLENLECEMIAKLTTLSADYFAKCARVRSDFAMTRRAIEPYTELTADLHTRLNNETDLFSLEENIRNNLIKIKDNITSLTNLGSLRFDLTWKSDDTEEDVLCLDKFGSLSADEIKGTCSLVRQFNATNSNDKVRTCIESISSLTNGNMALVDIGNNKVKVFSQLGRSLFCFVGSGTFFARNPYEVVPVDGGRMLISDPSSEKVILFNSNGIGLTTFTLPSCGVICSIGRSFGSNNIPRVLDRSTSLLGTSKFERPKVPLTRNDFERRYSVKLDKLSVDDKVDTQEVTTSESDAVYDILVCNTHQKSLQTLCVEGNDLYIVSEKSVATKCLFDEGACRDLRYITVNTSVGHIFVTNPKTCCVAVFSAKDGSLLNCYGQKDGLGTPGGMVIDQVGHLLLADTLNNRIHVLSPEGKFLHFLSFELIADWESVSHSLTAYDEIMGSPNHTYNIPRPFTLALDVSGRTLWIAERDGLIKQFNYLS